MSRATEASLDKLHGLLGDSILDELDRAMQRAAQHPDDPAYAVPPQLQAKAMDFLKMTGVTAPKAIPKAENVKSKLNALMAEDLDLDDEAFSARH